MNRTKAGNYFLVGHGGPRTHYGKERGSNVSGGSGAVVMSEQEALAWLQNHDAEPEDILLYFNLPEA